MKTPKPDYKWWAKADSWSLKEAALLLHGIDPYQHRPLRLAERDIPPEFSKTQKTYLLLQSIPWKERYAYHVGKGLCPLAVVAEAVDKELPLPKQLHDLVSTRFAAKKKTAKKDTSTSDPLENNNQPLSTRERRTFLKGVGILVKLLLDSNLSKKICSQGQKPSALQIAQLMLDKAEEIGMELEGLKSMDRKITEALALLAEESLDR